MTSPQPLPPADEGLSEGEQEALAALVTAIAEAGLIGAVALPPYLYAKLVKLGLRGTAVKAAARLALADPLGRRRVTTPARRPRLINTAAALVADQEPGYRGAYLLAAAKRITKALGLGADLFTALRAERRYYQAHLRAGRKRAAAAHAVDRLATQGWPWLMWQTRNDTKVERDCAGLHGVVFTRTDPPRIDGRPVFPGAAHLYCRCYPLPAPGPNLPGPTWS